MSTKAGPGGGCIRLPKRVVTSDSVHRDFFTNVQGCIRKLVARHGSTSPIPKTFGKKREQWDSMGQYGTVGCVWETSSWARKAC